MKIKVLFCFLIFSFKSFSQITPEWVAVYDSTSSINYIQWQMKVSPAGNVYVCGSTWDTAAFFNALLKYDTNGNLIWSEQYDSLSTYTGDMTIDANENIYLTGRFLNPATNLYYQYLTLKYDSAGNLQWATPFICATASSQPFGIAIDDSGNVYVTGESCNEIATVKYNASGIEQWVAVKDSAFRAYDITVDSLQNVYVTGAIWDTSGQNIMTLKYDINGNLLWLRKYHEGIYNTGYFIKMDNTGNLFVGGYIDSSGVGKIKLLKYDLTGNLKWISEFDSTWREFPDDMVIDENSNIYITGTLNASSGNAENYLTVKFDSAGQALWSKVYDGGSSNNARSIILDSSGNVYITGDNIPLGYITIKYDNNGNQLWVAPFGNYYAQAYSIDLDASGNIYVSGTMQQIGLSKGNIVTLKYGSTTGIPENDFSSQLLVSPNPASTEFQISNHDFKTGDEITLTDVLGKTLFIKTITTPTLNFKLQTSNFSNGIYFLQLKTKEGMMSKKVVVQR